MWSYAKDLMMEAIPHFMMDGNMTQYPTYGTKLQGNYIVYDNGKILINSLWLQFHHDEAFQER